MALISLEYHNNEKLSDLKSDDETHKVKIEHLIEVNSTEDSVESILPSIVSFLKAVGYDLEDLVAEYEEDDDEDEE